MLLDTSSDFYSFCQEKMGIEKITADCRSLVQNDTENKNELINEYTGNEHNTHTTIFKCCYER